MGIKVRFQGGPRAGQVLEFGADVQHIAIGRDPEKCQVVFPTELTSVGRHHCTLENVAGRYRLVINQSDPVLINGQRIQSSQELRSNVDLQLGRGGPILKVEPEMAAGLPPTDEASRLDGTGTRLRKLKTTSGRTRRLAVVVLLLLLATIGVGYQVKTHFDEQIVELSDAQHKLIARLADQYAVVNTRIDELKPKFEDISNQLAPSVYLVIKDDGHGHLDAQATAWVLDSDKNILATNGHVASMFETLDAGEKLIVRSAVPEVRDFTVTSVKIHPGYSQFRELWASYDPVVVASTDDAREVRSAGQACDVGLLFVKGNGKDDKLGPQLARAPDSLFPQMKRGYPICFVGFPMEGLVLDGVTLQKPDLSMQMAYVVSTTDYFGIPGGAIDDRQLVKHALPLAGGASGSPIVNNQGQVVAVISGGNMIGMTSDGRISSGANINFAQRIDLIAEMLNGTADSRQQGRLKAWGQKLQQLYKRRSKEAPKAQLAKALDWQRASWTRDLAAYGANQVTIKPADHYEGALAVEVAGGSQMLRHTFDVQAGDYLLSAATESDIELTLHATAARGGKQIGSSQAAANVVDPQLGTEPKWSRGISISLSGPATVEAQALSTSAAPHVLLQLDRADVHAVSKADRLAAIVKAWNQIVDDSSSTSRQAMVVAQKSQTLQDDKGTAVTLIGNTLEAGRYLAVAIPSTDVDINLWIGRTGDDAPLVDDRGPDHWAHGSFTLDDKTSIEAVVFGPSPKVAAELLLYRAE